MSGQQELLRNRAIYFDFKQNLHFLDQQNKLIKTEIETDSMGVQWNPNKIEVSHQNDEIEQQEVVLYNNKTIQISQCQTINNSYHYDFDIFFQGNNLFSNDLQVDDYYDRIRIQIENEDYVPDFQFMLDNNGFSSFGHRIIEMIDEECPKNSSICFPIYCQPAADQSQLKKDMQVVNEMLSFSSFFERDSQQLVVPIYLDSLLNGLNQYFDLPKYKDNNELLYLMVAPLISNITMPIRQKHSMIDLNDYLQTLQTKHRLNFFNVCYGIPRQFDIQLIDQKHINQFYADSIFNFKRNNKHKLMIDPFVNSDIEQYSQQFEQYKITKSYSESYSLKGIIDEFNFQKLNEHLKTYQLSVKIDQNVYLTEQYLQGMFRNHDQQQVETVDGFGMESCIFSHPSFGVYCQNLLGLYDQLPFQPISQFMKNDINNKDIIYQAIENIKNQMEEYLID